MSDFGRGSLGSFKTSRRRANRAGDKWETVGARDIVGQGASAPVWLGPHVGLRFTLPAATDLSVPGSGGQWVAFPLETVLGRSLAGVGIGAVGSAIANPHVRFRRTDARDASDVYYGVMLSAFADPVAALAGAVGGEGSPIWAGYDTAGGVAARAGEFQSTSYNQGTAAASGTAEKWIYGTQAASALGLTSNRASTYLLSEAGASVSSVSHITQFATSQPAYMIVFAGADVLLGAPTEVTVKVQTKHDFPRNFPSQRG